MNIFKRIGAALGASKPVDEMAAAYPQSALGLAENLSAYPHKVLLADQGVFAYRMEFATFEADAARVVGAIAAEFPLPSLASFQDGQVRNERTAAHFSLRPEFRGAVVVIVTNALPLIAAIDALKLQPPPPWIVFPDADPSALGSLQGDIEYWWDWLFLPFWSAADEATRSRYLTTYPTNEDWLEFLDSHAP